MRHILGALIAMVAIGGGVGVASRVQGAEQANLVWGVPEVNVGEGDFVAVPVEIRAAGKALDTVRMEVQFSPAYLQAVSVSLGELFPLVAPESHLDNTKGLISWGGFRLQEATKSSGKFATVTFRATKAGETQLTFGTSSKLYGAGKEEGSAEEKALKVHVGEEDVAPVLFTLSSSSHPRADVWERQARVAMQWQPKDAQQDFVYFFALDKNPTTTPRTAIPQEKSTEHRMVFESVEDGVWYFHLLAKDAKGRIAGFVHYPFFIFSWFSCRKLVRTLDFFRIFLVNGCGKAHDARCLITTGKFCSKLFPYRYSWGAKHRGELFWRSSVNQ